MRLLLQVVALVAAVVAAAATPVTLAESEVFPNGTTNGTVSPLNATHALAPRRHEMPWYVTCARFNKVFFKQWIIQVPSTWWKHKHNDDADMACRNWKASVLSHNPGGGTIWQECWDMRKKQYSSGKPHYLHMRFTTATWATDTKIEAAMWSALDGAHWKDDSEFNNLQVACASYDVKCESQWSHNNRCYHRSGGLHD